MEAPAGCDHTATIMQRGCWLTDGEANSLVVDAGPINMDVTCRLLNWLPLGQNRVTASFDFDAEAGRTYMFTALELPFGDKCISLFDSTFESTLISCEPYKKVE